MILKTARGQHRKYPPYALTEHGALMASTVLNRPRAGCPARYLRATQRHELTAIADESFVLLDREEGDAKPR